MTKPRSIHLPLHYYETLRAIHESRARRRDPEATIPFLSNEVIFDLLPDKDALDFAEAAQPAITAATLARMANTVGAAS